MTARVSAGAFDPGKTLSFGHAEAILGLPPEGADLARGRDSEAGDPLPSDSSSDSPAPPATKPTTQVVMRQGSRTVQIAAPGASDGPRTLDLAAVGPAAGAARALRSTALGLGMAKAEELAQQAAAMRGGTVALEPAPVKNPLLQTALGVAPEANPNPVPDVNPDAPPHMRTVLGVAMPGIAPLNPGVEKPSSRPPAAPPPGDATALPIDDGDDSPAIERRPGARTLNLQAAKKSSVLGTFAIGVAAARLAAAAVLLYLYVAGPERIEARVTLDPQGKERLRLRCPRCDDGTLVRVDGKEASFSGGQAELALERSLNVGDTPLTLAVRGPSGTQEHNVALNVRVDYRVRADLSTLSEMIPTVRVLVDALPGSTVSIGERSVTLSDQGDAQVDFDVSSELKGEDNGVRRLERRIPYTVTPPGGSRQTGDVIVQLGITPLVVDAPGTSITVETPTFVLAGRTAKGSSVTVEGRPLAVDPEGRFAQVMNVSSVGATTVTLRSTAPDHAPRLFPLEVRRVQSFAQEAAKLRTQVTTSYASIETDLDRKRDWKVALDGSVLERSNLEHSTLFLFDVKSGCQKTPCLARVAYGAKSELVPGDKIGVFGRVQGAVDGPRKDSKIPEISADFVLKANR